MMMQNLLRAALLSLLFLWSNGSAGAARNERRVRQRVQESAEVTTAASSFADFDRPRRKLQSVDVVGDNGQPSGAYPLGLCQGDCDSDSDCAGDMVCYQRDAGDPVPGCVGGESEGAGADICISPDDGGDDEEDDDEDDGEADSGSSSSYTSGSGRKYLKMHWEPDFYWQGESEERKWCVACAADCGDGVRVVIDGCDDGDPTPVSLERLNGGSTFRIRASGSNVCLEIPDDLEDYTSWQTCSDSELQRWTGRNGNAFGGGRFELSPASLPGYCLTQTHDPKRGERLWVATCEYARADDTSFWELY